MNYSKEAILRVFGKYFKTEEAAQTVERNPKALADIVYGNRGGNNEPKAMRGDVTWIFTIDPPR